MNNQCAGICPVKYSIWRPYLGDKNCPLVRVTACSSHLFSLELANVSVGIFGLGSDVRLCIRGVLDIVLPVYL